MCTGAAMGVTNVPGWSVLIQWLMFQTTADSMSSSSCQTGFNPVVHHAMEDIVCVSDFMIPIYINICERKKRRNGHGNIQPCLASCTLPRLACFESIFLHLWPKPQIYQIQSNCRSICVSLFWYLFEVVFIKLENMWRRPQKGTQILELI